MRAAADRASGVAMSWQFQRCFSAVYSGCSSSGWKSPSRHSWAMSRFDVAWEMWTLRVWTGCRARF